MSLPYPWDLNVNVVSYVASVNPSLFDLPVCALGQLSMKEKAGVYNDTTNDTKHVYIIHKRKYKILTNTDPIA